VKRGGFERGREGSGFEKEGRGFEREVRVVERDGRGSNPRGWFEREVRGFERTVRGFDREGIGVEGREGNRERRESNSPPTLSNSPHPFFQSPPFPLSPSSSPIRFLFRTEPVHILYCALFRPNCGLHCGPSSWGFRNYVLIRGACSLCAVRRFLCVHSDHEHCGLRCGPSSVGFRNHVPIRGACSLCAVRHFLCVNSTPRPLWVALWAQFMWVPKSRSDSRDMLTVCCSSLFVRAQSP
jgi:hypothetical protein